MTRYHFPAIKPMKPVTIDLDSLPSGYLYVQPKVDGIRGILRLHKDTEGEFHFFFQTASGKSIPNRWILARAKEWAVGLYQFREDSRTLLQHGIDGELIVEGQPFQKTTSLVMSKNMSGDITFVVFDSLAPVKSFEVRLAELELNLWMYAAHNRSLSIFSRFKATPLETYGVARSEFMVSDTRARIEKILENEMARGGEGIIIRQAKAKYLFGRATLRNPVISRIKPLEQAEATIQCLFEGETNENPQYIDDLGRAKRSTNTEGMIPNGQLGGFVVSCAALFKKSFRIGTIEGMTEVERIRIWENRHNQEYIGKLITFRYMKLGSTEDAPRQPIGIGFRDPSDLTTY